MRRFRACTALSVVLARFCGCQSLLLLEGKASRTYHEQLLLFGAAGVEHGLFEFGSRAVHRCQNTSVRPSDIAKLTGVLLFIAFGVHIEIKFGSIRSTLPTMVSATHRPLAASQTYHISCAACPQQDADPLSRRSTGWAGY